MRSGRWVLVAALMGSLLLMGSGCPKPATCAPCNPTPPPDVAYATTSVDCGGNTVDLSTGTNGGSCKSTEGPNGTMTGGTCQDGNNSASVTCTSAGLANCSATGSGVCKIQPKK